METTMYHIPVRHCSSVAAPPSFPCSRNYAFFSNKRTIKDNRNGSSNENIGG